MSLLYKKFYRMQKSRERRERRRWISAKVGVLWRCQIYQEYFSIPTDENCPPNLFSLCLGVMWAFV